MGELNSRVEESRRAAASTLIEHIRAVQFAVLLSSIVLAYFATSDDNRDWSRTEVLLRAISNLASRADNGLNQELVKMADNWMDDYRSSREYPPSNQYLYLRDGHREIELSFRETWIVPDDRKFEQIGTAKLDLTTFDDFAMLWDAGM